MKRLLPLILMIMSLCATASVIAGTVHNSSASIQVPDTTDLFHRITDISRQIEKHTIVQEDPLPDNPPSKIVLPPDTVLSSRISRDTIFPDSVSSVIIPSKLVHLPLLKDSLVYKNPLDSLYTRKENGTLQLPLPHNVFDRMTGLTFRDTLFYNPLFLPMIFNGRMLPRDISFYPLREETDKGLLIPSARTFAPDLEHADFIQKVRKDYYMQYPDRIRYSVLNFDSLPVGGDEIVRETFNPFRELLKTETTYSLDAPGVEVTTIDRIYWERSGEHSFQFAQNYFSNNWHKGGTNNLNFNSFHVLRANYRKEKVKFNNTLEWRLSVFNAPDDSIRRYRIGNDLIRYYGDFGVDAFMKGWSYSTNLEAKSQLFNAYPTNSNDLRSAFLAPLYVNAGVGLKFILDKKSENVRHRRLKWDLSIAPISINYKYVGNESVDVKRFGIPEGRRSVLDIGSTITSILKYEITRYITWDSRLTYFTSYDKVVSEFENSLNMSLSNAFSTRIYVNARYDDDVPADPDFKYWQINQTLSFGLNYKW